MKKWLIQIEIKVADLWIEDGFDMSKRIEDLEEQIVSQMLPYAYGHEVNVKAKIISKPDPKIIRKMQGYE